jgi:hypothetical protein
MNRSPRNKTQHQKKGHIVMSLQRRKPVYQNYDALLFPMARKPQMKNPAIATSNGAAIGYKNDASNSAPSTNSLPTIATANDVREIVRFLQHFPDGIALLELANAEPRRIFDARKIAAYEFWNIVKSDGKRIELTELGKAMAQTIAPEQNVYREILRSVPAYVAALDWIEQQELKIVTHFEIVNFWRQAHPELRLDRQDEKDIEAMVVSFFSLCHNAEIGTMTVGKRGQPARLRVEAERTDIFLQNVPDANGFSKAPMSSVKSFPTIDETALKQRVYLSCGNMQRMSLEQLCEILELADFDCVVAENTKPLAANNFIERERLALMNQCDAGIFILDDESCTLDANRNRLKNETLIEINAALSLYDWRVVICWLGQNAPPSELQANDLDFVCAENLEWETNLRLVQALKNLKSNRKE